MTYWNKRRLYGWGEYQEMRDLMYNEVATYLLGTAGFENHSGETILDLGCGCGIDSVEYALGGNTVYAVDISEESLCVANQFAKSAGVKIVTQVEDARHLSFCDEFFDHVHCMGVLHHIVEADKAITEMYRVLKRGGTFIAMLYNHDSLLYYHSILFLRGVQQNMFSTMTEGEILSEFSEAKRGCPYTRVYTVEEAKQLFSQFSDVSVEIHHNVYDTLTERKIHFDGPKCLGWHLVVRGRKI